MPMEPPKACQNPACKRPYDPVPSGQGYYHPECNPARQMDRERSQEAHRRLYHLPAWAKTRQMKLHRNPLCEMIVDTKACGRPAEVVHHKIDHKGNLQLFFSFHNLQALCTEHHNQITGQQHGFQKADTPVYAAAIPTGAAPQFLPVAPQHKDLQDGTRALKQEFGREYEKRGHMWHLLPVENVTQS